MWLNKGSTTFHAGHGIISGYKKSVSTKIADQKVFYEFYKALISNLLLLLIRANLLIKLAFKSAMIR
jgi:hypothetical protein